MQAILSLVWTGMSKERNLGYNKENYTVMAVTFLSSLKNTDTTLRHIIDI
jgi:hypothetical protein